MDEVVSTLVEFLKLTSYLKEEEHIDQIVIITKEGREIQMGTAQFLLVTNLLNKLEPQWRNLPQARYEWPYG